MPAVQQYVRRGDLHAVDMDGEIVMLDRREGSYYGLDGIAATLWELLESPRTLDDLCAAVVDEYDVDEPTAQRDLQGFLDELLARGLVAPHVDP